MRFAIIDALTLITALQELIHITYQWIMHRVMKQRLIGYLQDIVHNLNKYVGILQFIDLLRTNVLAYPLFLSYSVMNDSRSVVLICHILKHTYNCVPL